MQKLNKLLNITSSEWPRIIVSWTVNFLLRFGFILGWTIIVAGFLNRVGIQFLPVLFLGNALLAMIGTIIYRNFIHKIRKEVLISFSVLIAAALIITSLFFSRDHSLIYLTILLITGSVILSQVYIIASLFFEELFTPLESQRTFPLIESSEIFGTMAGGLVLSIYATTMAPYKFIAMWAISLILILPVVLLFNSKTMEIPKLENEEEILKKIKKKSLAESFIQIKKVSFLKALMWIVFLNWAIMNIVEFQYTKAIELDVLAMGSDFETNLVQKLGTLHVIFSAGTLFIQLVLASRIISSLGIVSSMLLHPIVIFLNGIIISLRYGFSTAAITKGTFEITNLIFSNAYNSSYYAVPHNIREESKELIQGIIKPIGALVATFFILLISNIFDSQMATFILNMILIFLSITMAVLISDLKKKYTDMSEENLANNHDVNTRLNAIEILGQNGHGKLPITLEKILKRKTEAAILKEKTLYTIGKRQETESLSVVLDMLDEPEDEIRIAAISTIMEFHSLEKKIFEQSLTRYFTIQKLKSAIEKEENDFVRELLVKSLYGISPDELTSFLIQSVETNKKHQSEFIKLLSLFKDANLIPYLEPYLTDKDIKLRSSAIIALWQFKKLRPKLNHILIQILNSQKTESVISGIEAAGITKNIRVKQLIYKNLKSENILIFEATIIALARLEHESIIPEIIKRITNKNHDWHLNKRYIFESLSKKFSENLKSSINLYVIEKINNILYKNKNESIEVMEKETLTELLSLYREIDAYHECNKIEEVLKKIK